MFVTDVVVEKESLHLMIKKLKTSFVFMFVFGIGIVASIATIIYGCIQKITDYNTYLFSAFGIVIAGFWLFFSYKEYGKCKIACNEITEKGKHVLSGAIEVNAEHSHNTSTIVNLICAILVTVCFVAGIVVQVLNFNPLTFYIIPITFVLTTYMVYQTIVSLINDKIYRNTIFSQN